MITCRHSIFNPETRKSFYPTCKAIYFNNRVMDYKETSELRNISDTRDVTEMATIDCQYALVYLGIHNKPPRLYDTDVTPHMERNEIQYLYSEDKLHTIHVRELHPIEMFCWIDLTNPCPYRTDGNLYFGEKSVEVDPEAAAMYPLWLAFVEERRLELKREYEEKQAAKKAAEDAKAEKDRIKQAKKEMKLEATKAEAEKAFNALPSNGTLVKVGDFAGKLFWKAVKAYKGKYSARIGVKDDKGNVKWANAEELV